MDTAILSQDFACHVSPSKATEPCVSSSNIYPYHKKKTPKGVLCGRGRWIRTNEMTESESVALPLGDTPTFNAFKLYQIGKIFTSIFYRFLNIFEFFTMRFIVVTIFC